MWSALRCRNSNGPLLRSKSWLSRLLFDMFVAEERLVTHYPEPVVSQRLSEEKELLTVILRQRRRCKQLIYRRCLEHGQAQDL